MEQELESLQQKNNRVSIELQKTSEDKEDLFNELMELKSLCVKHESVIATLKTQVCVGTYACIITVVTCKSRVKIQTLFSIYGLCLLFSTRMLVQHILIN